MKHPVLTQGHPLWQLFLDFHTGKLAGDQRAAAKALLFPIHYGSTDTDAAFKEVERIKRVENAH